MLPFACNTTLLASDVDPGENRKATKAAKVERGTNSFETITREWFARNSGTWNASHGERTIRRFERDLFPWIGGKPIAELTAPELLAAIRKIENRGAIETAHRALSNCGQAPRSVDGVVHFHRLDLLFGDLAQVLQHGDFAIGVRAAQGSLAG